MPNDPSAGAAHAASNVDEVRKLLDAHVDLHRSFPDSARLRDLGSEKALVQDYSGRVVFELVQNALDRARHSIDVRWDPVSRTLEVANDGQAFTTGPQGVRTNLGALLTLHTSSKTARESVGNKGVGFRSVFASSGEVEICSRALNGEWWGMRLRHPSVLTPVLDGAWTDTEVPSFYAPVFCVPTPEPNHCTVIRLKGVRDPSVIEASIRELQAGPLTFLERRGPAGLAISLSVGDHRVVHVLGEASGEAVYQRTEALSVAVQQSTGLDLDRGDVRVLWSEEASRQRSRYWSYLPTEQPAGFGLQVHADFYLSNSRRNLALRVLEPADHPTDPAGWNARLVRRAAECVADLWMDASVCTSDRFWALATPAACECTALKLEVARHVWADGAHLFEAMVRQSFPMGTRWPLRRYREFFDALKAWANFAYQRSDVFGGRARYLREWDLLARVQASGAPVLPVLTDDPDDPMVLGSLPLDARPLVAGQAGQQRGKDADRIYQLRFDPIRRTSLPDALRHQRAFVTTFDPAVSSTHGPQGLLPFDRLEILAQLQPGQGEDQHAELLRAVLELASQEARGGPGTLLQRVIASPGGAAWRFLPISEGVRRAGLGISGLCVPTEAGDWSPARECGTTPGPWPQVNRQALAEILGLGMDSDALRHAERLVGLTPIPLGQDGTCTLPAELPPEFCEALVQDWWRWGAFLDLEEGEKVRSTMVMCRWVHSMEGLGIAAGPDGPSEPYCPLDLWHQQAGRGFTTRLLPRFVLASSVVPLWMQQMGITNPAAPGDSRRRIHRAIQALVGLHARWISMHQRDLIEVYRSLVSGLLMLEDPQPVPLLVRPVDADGRREPVRWAKMGELVWHEPERADRQALRSFRDVCHWVVRKQPERRLAEFGLRHFRVERSRVLHEGGSQPELEVALRNAVIEALPDLLAASAASMVDFDVAVGLARFSELRFRHFDDVWIEWEFDGKRGSLGQEEVGDVFLRSTPDDRLEACFDGPHIPLARCAFPLSEVMAGNRAFGSLYKDALHAWEAYERDEGMSVQRFRREQGLSEAEVLEIREQVQALVMSADEHAAWLKGVTRVLSRFGALAEEPEVGCVIRPESFESAVGLSEDTLRAALSELGDPVPRVDFYHAHGRALEREPTRALLAEMAERNRGQWTEVNRNAWLERLGRALPDEELNRRYWDFDPVLTLRRRLGLPQDALTPQPDAIAFAEGQIPIRELPSGPALDLRLRAASSVDSESLAQEAQTEEDFVRQARRRAAGGRRAEDAVLELAVKRALRWRDDHPQAFVHAFDGLAHLFDSADGNRARGRLELAVDVEGMRRFLHVSRYVGNVGFDVLVPSESGFLLVEVKRVTELSRAVFFLSENERRRALRYARQGLDWRLWLVTGSGDCVDATDVLNPFERHQASIQSLAESGLRPGEWMFVLD